MKLVIVINHKGQRRLERISLTKKPITLGRGWGSDVVLDDRFVDAEHLRISLDEDKQVVVQDLGTVNGTVLDHTTLRNNTKSLKFGQPMLLGDTTIEVHEENEVVAPTAVRSPWYLLLERFSTWTSILVLSICTIALNSLIVWLNSQQALNNSELMMNAAGLLFVMLLTTLVFGLIGKLLRNETNFKAHWLLICLGIIGYLVIAFIIEVYSFNTQSPALNEWVAVLAYSALGVLLLVGFMTYATYLTGTKRLAWSLFVIGGAVLLGYAEQIGREEHESWRSMTELEQSTFPPAFLLQSPIELEDYIVEVDKLFETAPDN